jgi:hypothetical protein
MEDLKHDLGLVALGAAHRRRPVVPPTVALHELLFYELTHHGRAVLADLSPSLPSSRPEY